MIDKTASHIEIGYLNLLKNLIDNGEQHDDRTGVGTVSLLAMQLCHHWSDGFPLLTTKRVPLRWVATELKWILLGHTDEGWLRERGIDIWKEWATPEKTTKWGRPPGELGPTYGAMLRRFPVGNGTGRESAHLVYRDQLLDLVHDIKNNPNSRRNVVTLWHPHWQRHVDVPPCLLTFQVKCHDPQHSEEAGLSLHASFRSSDCFLGLPFDIASCALLQALLCRETGRVPRELVLTLGDAHLYNNHQDQAEEQLSRMPRGLPTLTLDYVSMTDWAATVDGYDPDPSIPAPVAV